MSDPPILLTPGPTIVPPNVREALARPMGHHRTAEFQAVLKEVGEGLKALLGTAQDVLILTSSGTGAMEAAVANLLSPGDEALVIRGGKFGERWGELCGHFGARAVNVDPAWGKPLDLKRVEQDLKAHPKIGAVFSTLCETSTGVCFDIRGIREAIRAAGSQALLVVDAISGLGADPFAMDAYGVDVTVCGSQKGLMLPPGLAFVALSPRAWAAVERSKSPRYYFDLRLAREAWKEADTPFTPAISLIVGLAEALRFILGRGLEPFVAGHQQDARELRAAAQRMGLELFTDPACASSAVTAIKVPSGVDGKELVKRIKKRGFVVAGGQGKELAGKVIRIATLGAVGRPEIRGVLSALEQSLEEMGWKKGVIPALDRSRG
ncbi:MAG: alanine--glyoxylate aminotransferase family protein [Candidatus Omnitrophica bacterium]|nr:alanine--glyoxylate aminotransferase family protein [Candidatus Omnitrophota bacterium]